MTSIPSAVAGVSGYVAAHRHGRLIARTPPPARMPRATKIRERSPVFHLREYTRSVSMKRLVAYPLVLSGAYLAVHLGGGRCVQRGGRDKWGRGWPPRGDRTGRRAR